MVRQNYLIPEIEKTLEGINFSEIDKINEEISVDLENHIVKFRMYAVKSERGKRSRFYSPTGYALTIDSPLIYCKNPEAENDNSQKRQCITKNWFRFVDEIVQAAKKICEKYDFVLNSSGKIKPNKIQPKPISKSPDDYTLGINYIAYISRKPEEK